TLDCGIGTKLPKSHDPSGVLQHFDNRRTHGGLVSRVNNCVQIVRTDAACSEELDASGDYAHGQQRQECFAVTNFHHTESPASSKMTPPEIHPLPREKQSVRRGCLEEGVPFLLHTVQFGDVLDRSKLKLRYCPAIGAEAPGGSFVE